MSKTNKDVFNALESASKSKPYTHVEKRGLVIFPKAQKKYKAKLARKFSLLNKTAKSYSKKPRKLKENVAISTPKLKKYLH